MRLRAASALRFAVCCAVAASLLTSPARAQAEVEYIGGTPAELQPGADGHIELTDDRYFAFYARKTQFRIPYDRVNLIEYGMQVDRRLALALVISPVFLLSKARKHFLTIGYAGERGQEAIVFRVDKASIRVALAALEARTGVKIGYQDQEARKAGN